MNFICKCACGKHYTAYGWSTLKLAGTQELPWGEVLELRNCTCGSTRAIVIREEDFDRAELDPRDPGLAVESLMRRVA